MQTLTQLADAVENALAEDADQETLDAIADLIAAVRATEQSGEAVAEVVASDGMDAEFKCVVIAGSSPDVGTKLYTRPQPAPQPIQA
ncbi:hypothetical protein, partial [Chromobacterium violaceum]|uniref:hypothetical protein n=1 Tax=Chromobacterium violaceum TaxID=536 RepID=UPI0005BD737D